MQSEFFFMGHLTEEPIVHVTVEGRHTKKNVENTGIIIIAYLPHCSLLYNIVRRAVYSYGQSPSASLCLKESAFDVFVAYLPQKSHTTPIPNPR